MNKKKKIGSKPKIIQGGINVSGNVVIKNSNIAGRDNVEKHVTNISYSFAPVYRALEKSATIPSETKKSVEKSVKQIEQEIEKGDKARGSFILERIKNIRKMAPDIAEVVIATLQDPALGISLAVKKLINKLHIEKVK